jgi:hypothetical protein
MRKKWLMDRAAEFFGRNPGFIAASCKKFLRCGISGLAECAAPVVISEIMLRGVFHAQGR